MRKEVQARMSRHRGREELMLVETTHGGRGLTCIQIPSDISKDTILVGIARQESHRDHRFKTAMSRTVGFRRGKCLLVFGLTEDEGRALHAQLHSVYGEIPEANRKRWAEAIENVKAATNQSR